MRSFSCQFIQSLHVLISKQTSKETDKNYKHFSYSQTFQPPTIKELATIYNRQIINLFNLSFNKRQNIFVVVAVIKLETNLK